MKRIIAIGLLACAFLTGCDIIPADERLLPMDEIVPMKHVLLVDFTDQDCINCPSAAKVIDGLTAKYEESLVAVSVHASSRNRPLVTPEGNEYEAHFHTNEIGHPAGLIDGVHLSVVYEGWESYVIERFNHEASATLDLSVDYDPQTREVRINTDVNGITPDMRLLLWVVEDGVVDWQKLPNNTTDPSYQHNHLFRAAVNGVWGQAIATGEIGERENSYVLNEAWEPANTSIVGFIYNASTNEVYDVKQEYLL